MAVSKPLPGQRIDPASPWARGLVVAVVGNQQGARVDNYAPALNRTSGVGTDLQTVGSPLGGALKFNGSTAVANFGTNANLSGTGKFCVAFRMNVRGLVRANFPTIYSSGYNGVEANLIIYFSANLADGRLFLQVANAGATGKTNTDFELAANQNRWFDVYVEFGGGTTGNIKVNGVNDYTVFGTQTRKTGFRNTTLGCIDLNGTNGRFSNVEIDYLYHWENRTLGAQEYEALRSNPWQLWPDEPQLVFAPASGTIIAVDGCSVGTSLDSSYLASYFAAQAISNAMASASSVQSSTAGVNAQGVSQASWNGLSASINGVDGASVAASASSVQTATILVLDANGSAVSCAISSVITQDVMVLSADGVTNGQALFQVDFSATAGVDGVAAGQAIGIAGQSAIVNVSGSASATSAASAGAAIVLSSDGTSESSSIVAGPGLGIFGADGAAGSAVGYATSSVDVQSIGAVSGSAIGHVVGDTFSGATATVSGASRAHSVAIGQLARVIGKDGRDVSVAVARAPKAIVLAKDARSESNSVTKAGRAGIGAATGRSESQAIARGDATTTVTANYPIAMDMTAVPPDSWMVLVPLETTTAAVSVYGDDATVPQEVTTVTVQSDDAIPVPVDTWKATA